MDFGEVLKAIFQHGGTVIMAVLFVIAWWQDKTKNNELLENNTKMLEALTESNKNIAEGNINIAKSLDIISTNLVTIDQKIDRNYEVELRREV